MSNCEEKQKSKFKNVQKSFQHVLNIIYWASTLLRVVQNKTFGNGIANGRKRNEGSLCESQWRCVHCNPITTGEFCKSLALSAYCTNHEQEYQSQIFGVDMSIGRPKGSCRKEISPFPRFGTKAVVNFVFLPKLF